MDMNLSKLQDTVRDREAWHSAPPYTLPPPKDLKAVVYIIIAKIEDLSDVISSV